MITGKPSIKNWRWAAFAIFLTLLFGVCFILGIIRNSYFNLPERLYFSVYILSLLALWGLGLQRRIFSRLFWRVLFFVHVLLFGLCLIYGVKYDVPLLWCVIFSVIEAMILIPYWIGLFIYAFRSKHIWAGQDHKTITTLVMYPRDRKLRRMEPLERCTQSIKSLIAISFIIVCLTFAPIIIRNNRVCYPEEYAPRYIEHMFKYRRTTIPQLKEFERLFPNYLYVFVYGDAEILPDANDNIQWSDSNLPETFYSPFGSHSIHQMADDDAFCPDPNSPVKWRLSAGLHKRYLMVMETDIIFAKMDPETKEAITPGSHDEPVFSLLEVRSVSIHPRFVLFGERFVSTDRKKLKTFTTEEWQNLVQADGDFSVLRIELKKNDPVRNFEKACWNNE